MHHLPDPAAVGPFFALRTDGPPGGCLPLGDDAVRARVPVVAERLGTDDTRVAASVAFQGIAGRLLSVALGAAVLTGRVPDLAGGRLLWHPARTAPDDLWLPHPAPPPLPADAGSIAATVVDGLLVPLHAATRAVVPISAQLLWGNAGSSLAGSARVLHDWCRSEGRPQVAVRAVALTRALFTHPLLRDTGTLRTRPAVSFVRRTCCLYYRVPTGGGMCGDCVLRHSARGPARR
ncbi:hypothetical protein GCM10010218_08020 [Streptomyces mashuensis]|uniref:Ferric siderophore reductase C-terminal domain-containing protein n=1 Tax=Streptomyces mashuensis TaxID=33904 RepID=A0A919AYA8_9ACTN|nr:(2Fe-2S)-binding protein [Streptomyces mashuensis]GHF29262.1 hypothetical protein GCM10010218_08020 [Streptomyces mashuensis]